MCKVKRKRDYLLISFINISHQTIPDLIKYHNIILLVGSLILINNPYHLLNNAFYYSFIISLGISLERKKIKGNKLKRLLIISSMCFILSLPITIYCNNEINLLTIILYF